MRVSLTLVASTCAASCSSSHMRRYLTCPYASSAVIHANGTRASNARASIAIACRGFVLNSASSGIPACRQRSRSAIHGSGR